MIIGTPAEKRRIKQIDLTADLTVIGGGLSGTCCAITAARQGIKVVLIQDRPLLGGNSSSEVRLWVLGATSHMGNNNRWAREGGVINEILIENTYRNEESNPLVFDTILLEKVVAEANITLLLNTAVSDLDMNGGHIERVKAFCSQNSTAYTVTSPLFCDASGDGIVGFLAGAAFRMGAESKSEFGEKFAPSAEYGELLGHSLYFYTKDTHRPVKFVPPAFALSDITKIPRYRKFSVKDQGCNLWWIEYGGRLDTVHDTEKIKWELWKVIYGVWNYIKNSGDFPEAETMSLEWVGTIPGKRESRRFEGDYMLKQQDIVEQREFEDVVAFGGWSIDLHPADGIFSELPGCNQWHSKGIYGIPYRCYYSRNIQNLFLAGRIISATHVAFGSSRVMGTCSHGAQAVGVATSLCKKYGVSPSVLGREHIKELQLELLKTGQHLPGVPLNDSLDLVRSAQSITSSSTMVLSRIPGGDLWKPIAQSAGQMLPVQQGKMPEITLRLNVLGPTELRIELRKSSKPENHTPDVTLDSCVKYLKAGVQDLVLDFDVHFTEACYAFVCIMKNELVQIEYSKKRISGILSVFNSINPAVSNYGKQEPPEDIGVDAFEFWCPQRRPEGQNFALSINPGLTVFSPENLRNGWHRPVSSVNAWVADYTDREAKITISWGREVTIKTLTLSFDCDYDHPMENVLMRQNEDVQPFCATEVRVYNCNDVEVGRITRNHQALSTIHFETAVTVQQLKLVVSNSNEDVPVSLFEVRCYN
ncbi:FAD-dependent oxidoreductase [Pedobacter ginsengisoli]|uniref:FAD-dependent oxidoreductase n=1 Tax=Pedobacter ginsengisoli TaxID=363852 RepID=UPI00254C8B13|nr:FAD-dependent oxidoreductase [Pedobacter ginsengisoli]